MSSTTLPFTSTYYRSSELPPAVWECMQNYPRSSNIVYAYAQKAAGVRDKPGSGHAPDLWVICWSAGTPGVVDFVLSCTTGPIGPYPIFIYSPLSLDALTDNVVQRGVRLLVGALHGQVPPERVFSVFAVDIVADTFAAAWAATSGIRLAEPSVYYHAKLMYCSKRTFKPEEQRPLSGYIVELRPALLADAHSVARLCHGFAAGSEPFVLTEAQAIYEATTMIHNNQVWVHTIQRQGQPPEVACIVAVTRTTETVAAITKVYTNPTWRSRGCAERLVRYVCHSLLQTKESVVLYVAHNNPAAANVYGKVGFVGFSSSADGSADSWKELGFDRAMVRLGHW